MNTIPNPPAPLWGFQKTNPQVRGENLYHAIHFCVMYPGRGQETVRIMVRDGDGYNTLEEAIASLPEPLDATIKELEKMIAKDYGWGFGTHYPEYGVVAKSNAYIYDRPFAEYKMASGENKFIRHPHSDLMVKRIKEQ